MKKRYFDWMCDLVCGDMHPEGASSFRKLLIFLHETPFVYTMKKDADRAKDGEHLRYRFASFTGCDYDDIFSEGPCSMLEMMIALALRCEETIMDDPRMGNRTRQWFWRMVISLGLGGMTDSLFDKDEAEQIVERFTARKYEPDGRGGLFTIKQYKKDLRQMEIWDQMCAYLYTMVHN